MKQTVAVDANVIFSPLGRKSQGDFIRQALTNIPGGPLDDFGQSRVDVDSPGDRTERAVAGAHGDQNLVD